MKKGQKLKKTSHGASSMNIEDCDALEVINKHKYSVPE